MISNHYAPKLFLWEKRKEFIKKFPGVRFVLHTKNKAPNYVFKIHLDHNDFDSISQEMNKFTKIFYNVIVNYSFKILKPPKKKRIYKYKKVKHKKERRKGKVFGKIVAPDGMIYRVKNLLKFCETHNLRTSGIWELFSGKLKSHRGWKLPVNQPNERICGFVLSPHNRRYKIGNIRRFCKDHNLTASSVCRLLSGKLKSHRGWKKSEKRIHS